VCSLLAGPPPSGEGPVAFWDGDAVAREGWRRVVMAMVAGFAGFGTSAVKLSVMCSRGTNAGRTHFWNGGGQTLHSRQPDPEGSMATQRASSTNY
jgi:hypothetical protein